MLSSPATTPGFCEGLEALSFGGFAAFGLRVSRLVFFWPLAMDVSSRESLAPSTRDRRKAHVGPRFYHVHSALYRIVCARLMKNASGAESHPAPRPGVHPLQAGSMSLDRYNQIAPCFLHNPRLPLPHRFKPTTWLHSVSSSALADDIF